MFLFSSTILFICSLFIDAVNKSGHTMSKDQMAANEEMEREWKQAVVAYFKVLSSHLPRGTEENYKKKPRQSASEPKFNPAPP
jgi:Mor family transcriptional regulator